MLKPTVVLVLLACCTTYATNGRILKQTAIATGSVTSTGGRSTAKVKAVSKSKESMKSEIVKFCKAVFNDYTFPEYEDDKKGYCENAYSLIDEDIKAVGKAVAEAYAGASVQVSVKGSGSACGSAKASAEAEAKAFAEIFINAIVNATNKYDKAEIEAAIETRIDGFAAAFAAAWAEACAKDNSAAISIEEAYARASVELISTVSIWLIAGVDCTGHSGFVDGDVSAENKINEDVTTETSSKNDVVGNAVADGGSLADAHTGEGKVGKCTGIYAICCGDSYKDRMTCSCFSDFKAHCSAKRKQASDRVWMITGDDEYSSCSCH